MTDVDWNEFHEFEASPVKKGGAPDKSAKGVQVKTEDSSQESEGLIQQSRPSEEQNS
jgi:hypothetical protein